MKRLCSLAVLLGFFALFSTLGVWYWQRPTLLRWKEVQIGDSEERVVELLGLPARQYNRESAPPDYYLRELSYRVRPITSKVYIYVDNTDLTMFVWFGNDGKVEDIFIGGT